MGGALLESHGQPARGFAFRRLPTLWALVFEATLVNQLWPRNPVNRRYRCLDADYSQQQEVEQPAGACLAITRACGISSAASMSSSSLCGSKTSIFANVFAMRRDGPLLSGSAIPSWRRSQCRTTIVSRPAGVLVHQHAALCAQTFLGGQVLILRLAIIKGMLLRSIGALFGARKHRWEKTLSAYWAVVRKVR